jgi:hypothetical protein
MLFENELLASVVGFSACTTERGKILEQKDRPRVRQVEEVNQTSVHIQDCKEDQQVKGRQEADVPTKSV